MSQREVDARPFDLPGVTGDGSAAALCLHGLSGTPYEVRPLGEALAARGIRALGPSLPGHGSPDDLSRISHTAWQEAALCDFRTLRAQHERVFVVGVSLGGLLALWLTAEERADALVVIGTPLRLRSPLLRLVPIAKYFLGFLPKKGGSDIREPGARARHPSMPVMPLASVHELVKLQRQVAPRLGEVTEPILIAHGRLDATAHPDDARMIAAGVGSPERELLWLERSGHVVPVDHDGPELASAVVDFLTRPRPALCYVRA